MNRRFPIGITHVVDGSRTNHRRPLWGTWTVMLLGMASVVAEFSGSAIAADRGEIRLSRGCAVDHAQCLLMARAIERLRDPSQVSGRPHFRTALINAVRGYYRPHEQERFFLCRQELALVQDKAGNHAMDFVVGRLLTVPVRAAVEGTSWFKAERAEAAYHALVNGPTKDCPPDVLRGAVTWVLGTHYNEPTKYGTGDLVKPLMWILPAGPDQKSVISMADALNEAMPTARAEPELELFEPGTVQAYLLGRALEEGTWPIH